MSLLMTTVDNKHLKCFLVSLITKASSSIASINGATLVTLT